VTSCQSAIRAVAADDRSAGFLELALGTPLLAMERVNRAADGSPVHVVQYVLRTDRVPVVDVSVNPSFGR
jgi:DNA-binding GntR family transcriptional regulator